MSSVSDAPEAGAPQRGLGLFERYLSLWVLAGIVVGVGIGQFLPSVPATLQRFTYAEISIPIAVLIWLMIFPMMLQIDFGSVLRVRRQSQGLTITLVVNWLIKPFSMLFFAWFFLRVVFAPFIPETLAMEYIAGAILLGAAPCTAMVFVWSYLTRGDPSYTLVQVAVNDLIMLVAFAPIVALLLGVSNVVVPYDTLFLSVVLYIVVPLVAGYLTRSTLIRRYGQPWFETVFLPRFGPTTMVALLATLVLIFMFQGAVIIASPLHIALIAVPLILQTIAMFAIAYAWARAWRVRHDVAAPAALIGASNFFELAVATAIVLFGVSSGAALAAVVGVLVEVPIMLMLVRFANRTQGWFGPPSGSTSRSVPQPS